MIGALRFLLTSLALTALIAPAVGAAPIASSTPSAGQAVVMRPLTLIKLADLNFGDLTVTTGGASTISSVTGFATLTGGLVQVGGAPAPARFRGTASRLSLVIVRSSTPTVLLRRSGGTETLTLNNLTVSGGALRVVGNTPFDFAIGGRLTVPAGTLDGVYSATFDITVEYF